MRYEPSCDLSVLTINKPLRARVILKNEQVLQKNLQQAPTRAGDTVKNNENK